MLDYTNPNFDIQSIDPLNNIDGLNDISSYLDFAISTTIHSQMPNVDMQTEKIYAKQLLNVYFENNIDKFTRTYNVRSNIQQIPQRKVKNLLIKTLIERKAYNQGALQLLRPIDHIGECADYATSMIQEGRLNEIQNWITNNLSTFIDEYIDTRYKQSQDSKERSDFLLNYVPDTRKAMEQLELEISLKRFKTK